MIETREPRIIFPKPNEVAIHTQHAGNYECIVKLKVQEKKNI